jgi:hypothetical protein
MEKHFLLPMQELAVKMPNVLDFLSWENTWSRPAPSNH